MRFSNIAFFLSSISAINGFTPQPQTRTTPLNASTKPSQNENIVVDTLEAVDATVKGAMSGMALAAALWVAPATMAGPLSSTFPDYVANNNNNMISSSIANAKEMASGSGTRVNKDPESLLRLGLPIKNKEVCFVYICYLCSYLVLIYLQETYSMLCMLICMLTL